MRRWRRILIKIGIALGLVISISILHHYQLRFSLSSYIAELRARGEPMDLAQVTPPPTPPEQNGVPFILSSITNLDHGDTLMTNAPTAMRIVAPGRAMIGWQQPDIRGFDGVNTWEDLAGVLALEKSKIDNFQSLTNHPVLDFNLDYPMARAHLGPLWRAADVLNALTLYNLHQGNVNAACANVRTVLAIVKGLTEERMQFSQSLRTSLAHRCAAGTWEILQDSNISERDLEGLERAWQLLDFVKAEEQAYLAERVLATRSMELYQRNPDEMWEKIITFGNVEKLWCKHQWLWFWSYADEKRTLEIDQVLINATRTAETNHSYQSAKKATTECFARLGLEEPKLEKGFRIDVEDFEMRWLFSEDAHDSFEFLSRAIAAETVRNAVITAIALKRYQLRQHHLPDRLEELTPTFVKAVPIDWMDGQALRYHRNADGTFLLYSVGENGQDDGGNPSLEKHIDPNKDSGLYWFNPYVLDLVWPQPATLAETQKYYAHQALYRKIYKNFYR